MATAAQSVTATGCTPVPPVGGRRFHRIADVRRQQSISLRTVSRQLNMEMREVKAQEEETCDLCISELQAWQNVLQVPIASLLVDDDAPLSAPVLQRAQLLKLMKTAQAMYENVTGLRLQRMVQTFIDQLITIMPELQHVHAWHAVGQRRTLDEVGAAVQRGVDLGNAFGRIDWNE